MTSPDDPGPTPSFAEVLTEAIQARGLSLERIRARLDAAGVLVSIATLSYWQSGRSFPTRARSYHTLVELESILNLEAGFLTSLTHTADGRTRRELFEWQRVMPVADLVTGILADLAIDMQGQLSRVQTVDVVTIAADGSASSQITRTMFRAERAGQHRWPVVLDGDGPELESPGIETVFGCTLGEVVTVPERRLTVAEMIAPRTLARGDLFLAEHRVTWPGSGQSSCVERAIAEPMRTMGISVQFDPASLPVEVHGGYRTEMGGPEPELTERYDVPLTNHETQLVRLDVKPGVYGVYWSWS